MQKCLLHIGIVVLAMCVMVTGCKKADTAANTAADPQLTFAVQSDNPLVNFSTTVAGKPAFVWTSGIASINRIQLNSMHGGSASQYATGSYTDIDLFAGSSNNISIPKGDYTTAKAAIFFMQTTTTDYPLMLKGTYTSAAGVVLPLEFDLNDNVEVDVPVVNIIADGTKNFTSNIAVHLNILFNGIAAGDIDAATRTNGMVLISKTVNTTLYAKMKANMSTCSASTLTSQNK